MTYSEASYPPRLCTLTAVSMNSLSPIAVPGKPAPKQFSTRRPSRILLRFLPFPLSTRCLGPMVLIPTTTRTTCGSTTISCTRTVREGNIDLRLSVCTDSHFRASVFCSRLFRERQVHSLSGRDAVSSYGLAFSPCRNAGSCRRRSCQARCIHSRKTRQKRFLRYIVAIAHACDHAGASFKHFFCVGRVC